MQLKSSVIARVLVYVDSNDSKFVSNDALILL